MRKVITTVVFVTAALFFGSLAWSQDEPRDISKEAPSFTDNDELIWPENMDEWVFLGSSLGMGYSQVDFNPDTPGSFQVVSMEPAAYQEFLRTGKFANGTMIALGFYGSETNISINESGFVMGDLQMVEIHYKDKERFPEHGYNFYMFHPGDESAAPLESPDGCISCHDQHGAYDSVFTQFYPTIRDKVPGAEKKTAAHGH